MTTERLRYMRAKANKVFQHRRNASSRPCFAFSFIPKPFIKYFLASFFTAHLLSSHLTSLDRSSWAFIGKDGETCLYLPGTGLTPTHWRGALCDSKRLFISNNPDQQVVQ